MDPPWTCPNLVRNVSIKSKGGSFVFVRKTHIKREASSTMSKYEEKPSYERTTLSSFLLGFEYCEVEARMKPKSI